MQAIAHPSPYFSHLIKRCGASVFSLTNTDIAKVKKIEPSVEESGYLEFNIRKLE